MKRLAIPLLLLVVGVGLVAYDNQATLARYVPIPAVAHQSPEQAVIFYESKTKGKLPAGVQQVIEQAAIITDRKVQAHDWDIKDRTGKTPGTLQPFLSVCRDCDRSRAWLVLAFANRYDVTPCPDSIPAFQEAIR